MRFNFKETKGQALIIIAVLFLFLIAGLEAAVLLYIHNHHRLKVKEITLMDDFYYAHAGIERAKWKIKVTPMPSGYQGEVYYIPGTNVPIVITVIPQSPSRYRVNSFVLQLKAGGELSIARRVEAIFERQVLDDGKVQVNLLGWRELSPQ